MATDDEPLAEEFQARYGDCAVDDGETCDLQLCCQAVAVPDSPLISVNLDGAPAPDLFEVTSTFLRPLRGRSAYREVPSPRPGWRVLADTSRSDHVLLATSGSMALLAVDEEPLSFWIQHLVAAAHRVQERLLFLHAASLGIDGVGVLLLGQGYDGKSTTALALASAGHDLYSDDVAAVRRCGPDLVPYRESVNVRPGPLPSSLLDRLACCPHAYRGGTDGVPQQIVCMAEVFPVPSYRGIPLRAAFLLDGFSDQPAIRRFRPDTAATARLKAISNGMIASWGPTPARHVLAYLGAVHLLSQLHCFAIKVGPPGRTADLIESTTLEAVRGGGIC